jgi:ATP-dependent Lhr-like helicase
MTDNVFSLLSKPLREQIEKNQWENPTRIQNIALPPILEGKNVLLIAPTGTGKRKNSSSIKLASVLSGTLRKSSGTCQRPI